ncbi:MAG: putative sulfate/molybdate transporter [Candidatus Thermoplasmatota archaeon]
MDKKKWSDFRFNLEEAAGAVGDYGTLFPIIIGVAVVSELNLGYILLFFSLWYIITGLYYKKPVPVEPMKAIGAIVIGGGLTQGQITASGIILGLLFLVVGFGKGMKYIQKKVPKNVIRGVQLGLALILLKTSLGFISKDYLISGLCIVLILAFFALRSTKEIPNISSLLVLLLGLILGVIQFGLPSISLLPFPSVIVPSLNDFVRGGWLLAIPQAPLTMTNAILATSLLMGDLFSWKVDPDKFSKTIGLMNLSSVPFGGFPMCHGSGGLAAQYRYGARTGGSNIISGLLLLPIALFFSTTQIINLIPYSVFGALIVFVGLEMGKHGLKTDSYLITGVMAVVALLTNITIAFILGLGMNYVLKHVRPSEKG